MSDETRQAVIMTDEEKAEFEAFRKEKARKARQEKQKADREAYKQWWMRRSKNPSRY